MMIFQNSQMKIWLFFSAFLAQDWKKTTLRHDVVKFGDGYGHRNLQKTEEFLGRENTIGK
jgi:hypothetical protein